MTSTTPELVFLASDLRRVQQALRSKLPALIDGTVQARERGHHRTMIALAGAHGGICGAISTIDLALAELAEATAYHEAKGDPS